LNPTIFPPRHNQQSLNFLSFFFGRSAASSKEKALLLQTPFKNFFEKNYTSPKEIIPKIFYFVNQKYLTLPKKYGNIKV
jgi:hypothetical protein